MTTSLNTMRGINYERQDAQESLKELRSKAASARQKADEARASQAASSTQNRVLDGLNKLKKSGRLEGFHVSIQHGSPPEYLTVTSGSSWIAGCH